MDENAPAFVLELEIDDEVSFKPMKNKRALQTLDSNTLSHDLPEKRRQKLKTHCTTTSTELQNISADDSIDDALTLMANMNQPENSSNPAVLYSTKVENSHKPKYSQAEVDSMKLEWDNILEGSLNKTSLSIRSEMETKMHHTELRCSSLQTDKEVLENQVNELLTTLRDNRTDGNNEVMTQIKVLTDQIQKSKTQIELLTEQHDLSTASLKASYDNRISEMIKSHATSILSMQDRVTSDISATWQEKLEEERRAAAALRQSLNIQATQIAALHDDKAQAVKDAKKKMYDKIMLQFEAGNSKYDALKKSNKESQQQLQSANSKIDEQSELMVDLNNQLKNSREETAQLNGSLSSIEAALVKILSSISAEPLESTDSNQKPALERIIDKIRTELTSKADLLLEMDCRLAESRKDITRLNETVQVAHSNLSAIHTDRDTLKSLLSSAEEEMSAVKIKLRLSMEEKEAQMLVIANMITEKELLTSEKEKLQDENGELTKRCQDLRKMNEEVMSMLEKMYAGKD